MANQSKQLYDYILVETIEEGSRKVTAAPENWVINGKLHWPTKDVNSKRKKQVPPENEWLVYDCKILGESFASLKDALARERFYEQFSNTESELDYLKRKDLKRKHPVSVDLIDANHLFDAVQAAEAKKIISDAEVVFDSEIPAELLDCQYLSEESNLSAVEKAILEIKVPNEHSTESDHQLKLYCAQTNQFQIQPIPTHQDQYPVYSSQLAQTSQSVQSSQTAMLSQDSGHFIQYAGQSIHSEKLDQNPVQLSQSNRYSILPIQNSIQLGQNSLPNHHPLHWNHYPVYQSQSNTIQGADKTSALNQPSVSSNGTAGTANANCGKVIVVEQRILDANEFSRPMKNTSGRDRVQNKKSQRKDKAVAVRKRNNTGKENRVASKKAPKGVTNRKSKNIKVSQKSVNKEKKTIKPNISEKKSGRELEIDRSTPSTSSASNFIKTYAPSHDRETAENSTLQHEYLPLIYKELLEIKALCKNNQTENNKNFEEIKRICVKLSQSEEDANPFADGSLEAFEAEFPKKKKKHLKELVHELRLEESKMKAKLQFKFRSIGGDKPRAMIRECMQFVVCDSVLLKYSWKGARGKPAFFKLTPIWTTLHSAVNACFRKYTRAKFSAYMSEYIKHASQRNERYLRRKNLDDDESGEEASNGGTDDGMDGNDCGNDSNEEDDEGEEDCVGDEDDADEEDCEDDDELEEDSDEYD